MWLFKAPANYGEMRNKISTSIFWITLIETFVLTQVSSDFSRLITWFSFGKQFEINNIELSIALLYLPAIISIIENIFKLHDKFGNIVKLSDRYSGSIIFHQYLKEFDINKTQKECRKLYLKNEMIKDIVNEHFYYHVSSTNPLIDSHIIIMALDAWCWVWILIDSIVVSLLFLLGSIVYSMVNQVSKGLFIGLSVYIVVLLILTFLTLKKECVKYTIEEVKASIKYDKEEKNNEKNNRFKERISDALQHK